MKIIGRILLIVAGVWLCINAIPELISSINYLNEVGWSNAFINNENIAKFVNFCGAIFYLLLALAAFIGFIRGKKSFIMGLGAIRLMILPITLIILAVANGQGTNGEFWYTVITGFALPIIYFLGFLFI